MFPHVEKSRKLKILPPEPMSSESSGDDNDDDDFEKKQLRRYLKTRNQKVYMFSQFIKVFVSIMIKSEILIIYSFIGFMF